MALFVARISGAGSMMMRMPRTPVATICVRYALGMLCGVAPFHELLPLAIHGLVT